MNEEFNFMSLEEMRRHEWVVSWSGGKDSTATIILMHENKIPIKRIIHVRMMYDDNLPATLPIMTEFINIGVSRFKQWGYNVEIINSNQSALDVANCVYKRSKNKSFNGHRWGITPFMRGSCRFAGVKCATVKKILSSDNEYEMVGYAFDEYKRLHRLGGLRHSILCTLNITTPQIFKICRDYGLLSPLYGTGISRDGCFFCPNANKAERENIKQNYPELLDKINYLISLCDYDISGLRYLNNWLIDYYADLDRASDSFKQSTLSEYILL